MDKEAKPFFSVIITTYNRPNKLVRAINSLLHQTFINFEIIIVNDGSTLQYNEVEEMVRNYDSIRYFYKKNEERSVARNFGVSKSLGQFICFLDDDDYYLPHHLEVLYTAITSHKCTNALYHTYSLIKKNNTDLIKSEIAIKSDDITFQEYYVTDGIMTMNSTCGAKCLFEEFPYESKLVYAEDHNQRLRAMSKYPVFQIKEFTNVYDKSDETSTSKSDIKVINGYLYSWYYSFNDPLIKSKIRLNIQKSILYNYYHLLLNYHRREISYYSLFECSIHLFRFKPCWETLKIVGNSLRWKLTGR